MAEKRTIAAVTAMLYYLKVVHMYMNNHLKHIVCFIDSENSLYLTETPESSAR